MSTQCVFHHPIQIIKIGDNMHDHAVHEDEIDPLLSPSTQNEQELITGSDNDNDGNNRRNLTFLVVEPPSNVGICICIVLWPMNSL
mmetsp:Transcript_34119/g.36866  ORF Transcript_34119/g.36866 Transcript_34119/m.36866 type:complete len:86 (+) Transcript_34119:69-326(+)